MTKYFHTALRGEHKTFTIKNKDEKRKYVIDYFSCKQFRNLEKTGEAEKTENDSEPNILGYCKLRRLKKDDKPQERVFCAANQEYAVSSKKSLFQRKIGYIRVISESEVQSFSADGSAVPQTEKKPFTYLVCMRFSCLPLLLLLPLFFCFFSGFLEVVKTMQLFRRRNRLSKCLKPPQKCFRFLLKKTLKIGTELFLLMIRLQALPKILRLSDTNALRSQKKTRMCS